VVLHLFKFTKIDWLIFERVSFSPDSSIGQLCEDLNKIARRGTCYDRFEIQDTKWLWFVCNKFTALNNNKILCGCFGMYPSFVAGILNTAKRTRFFVLCNEFNYENYMKSVLVTECSVCYKSVSGCYFIISYHGESISIYFETRLFSKLPCSLKVS